MKLKRKTDYAIMILALLAQEHEVAKSKSQTAPLRLVSVGEIARRTGVSNALAHKLVSFMVECGWIESKRGRAGGVRMQKSPDSINLAELVTKLEGPLEITVCSRTSESNCSISSTCFLNGRWEPVNLAIKNSLSQLSLRDLMQNPISNPAQTN